MNLINKSNQRGIIAASVISACMCAAASAATITVNNGSFEDETTTAGNVVGQAGGVTIGWTTFGRVQRFIPNDPVATGYPTITVPDGDVLAGTQDGASNGPGGSGLYQDLGVNFVVGNTYTFTLEVGGGYENAAGNLTIAFTSLASDLTGSLLASNSVAFPAAGDNFVTNTVSYTALPSDDGNPIRILLGTADVNQTMTFDNAQVSFVPEPSYAILLGLGSLLAFRRRLR